MIARATTTPTPEPPTDARLAGGAACPPPLPPPAGGGRREGSGALGSPALVSRTRERNPLSRLWLIALLALITAALTRAQPTNRSSPQVEPPIQATSTVGIEGQVLLRADAAAPTLTAKRVDRAAAVVLRIADRVQDGDTCLYDLRFIAQRPGTHDLRDSLRRADDSALNLDPIPVRVSSLLPAGYSGDLFEFGGIAVPRFGRYTALILVVGVIWLLPVAWALARRIHRRPAEAPPESGPARTLGDQLRPFIDSAIAGNLDTESSAALEMLLLAYWRRHRRIEGLAHADAIAALREDPEAGGLLRAMDAWLHAPATPGKVDVSALLLRYRDIEPIELPERAAALQEVGA